VLKDPIDVAAATAGERFTLDMATVYVCRRGVSPARSREIARQVLACYVAGIASTFAATYTTWCKVNVPTEIRNRIVGVPRVLH